MREYPDLAGVANPAFGSKRIRRIEVRRADCDLVGAIAIEIAHERNRGAKRHARLRASSSAQSVTVSPAADPNPADVGKPGDVGARGSISEVRRPISVEVAAARHGHAYRVRATGTVDVRRERPHDARLRTRERGRSEDDKEGSEYPVEPCSAGNEYPAHQNAALFHGPAGLCALEPSIGDRQKPRMRQDSRGNNTLLDRTGVAKPGSPTQMGPELRKADAEVERNSRAQTAPARSSAFPAQSFLN